MNTINDINKNIFLIFRAKYPAFEKLTLIDNVLTYKEDSVDLDNFNLEDFSNHNGFCLDILSAEDLFKVLRIHSITINRITSPIKSNSKTLSLPSFKNEDKTDKLSIDRFLILVRYSEKLEDNTELDDYFEIFADLFAYEDFLIPEVKSTLDIVKKIFKDLEATENKPALYDYIMDKYYSLKKEAEKRKQKLSLILESTPVKKTGYIDASIILVVLIQIGIIIAALILAFTK